MGKNEDYLPQFRMEETAEIKRRKAYEAKKAEALLVEKEKAENAKRLEEEIKTAPIERREAFEIALSSAVNNASIEITTKIFGEMTFKNQSETQSLRFNIRMAITNYLKEDPQLKDLLDEETRMLKGDIKIKILTDKLVVIYNNNKQLNSDKSLTLNEEVILTPDERRDMLAVVRSVVETYLSEAPKGFSFYKEKSTKEFTPITKKNKSEVEARKFIMSLAVKFFKENKRVPHENELLDMARADINKTK